MLSNSSFAEESCINPPCDCDGDGYTSRDLCGGDDCNDQIDIGYPINPGAIELCSSGEDEDCDDLIDCDDPDCCVKGGSTACPKGADRWYFDNDHDTYMTCEGDCNDEADIGYPINPGAIELCSSGEDEDCDDLIDCDDPDCANDIHCENEIPEFPIGHTIPLLLTLLAAYKLKF